MQNFACVFETKHWTLGTMIHIKLLETSLAHSRHSRSIFQHHLHHHYHHAEQRGNPRVCEKHWAHAFYSYQPEARKSDKQIGKNLKYVARAEHQPQKPHAKFGAGWGLEMQELSLWKVEIASGDVCCKPWVFHEFKVRFNLFLIKMNLWDPYGNHLGRECHPLPQQISKLIYLNGGNMPERGIYDHSKEKHWLQSINWHLLFRGWLCEGVLQTQLFWVNSDLQQLKAIDHVRCAGQRSYHAYGLSSKPYERGTGMCPFDVYGSWGTTCSRDPSSRLCK